jgi:Spy/CpxP family protein refolding chaperone
MRARGSGSQAGVEGVEAPPRGALRSVLLALVPVFVVGGAFLLAPSVGQGWGGFRGGPGGHGPPREHIVRMAEGMLKVIDATEPQRTSILAIVERAADAMDAAAERHRANHDAWVAALSGPSVDRATLERLRQEELALAVQASQALVIALGDVAEQLTPEQRGKLVDLDRLFHPEER